MASNVNEGTVINMYIEERHQAILDIIAEEGRISTSQIQEKFGVGYESAKRDLRILEEKGLLRRTYGGAIPVGELTIGKPRNKAVSLEKPEEWAISAAERALRMICDGETVFIGGGACGSVMAKTFSEPSDSKMLCVITDSPKIAAIIGENKNIRLIIVGGEVVDGTVSDGFAVNMLSKFRIDRAFIETGYYSESFGLSCDTTVRYGFLDTLVRVSRKITVILTRGVRGKDGGISVCGAERIDAVI